MPAYSAPMMPEVDYQLLTGNLSFSLTDLEFGVLESYSEFLNILKSALLKENLMQVHELIIAHLATFLGATISLHMVLKAEALEPYILELIKHQAEAAYQHFNRYPINSTVKSHAKKIENLNQGRSSSPGSIIAQTMRLERLISEILEELYHNRKISKKRESLLCPQETLIKILFLVVGKRCGEWREQLSTL